MTEGPTRPPGQADGRLIRPPADEARRALPTWRLAGEGRDGDRRGVHILKLVVGDDRRSQEAALARTVLDELARQRGG